MLRRTLGRMLLMGLPRHLLLLLFCLGSIVPLYWMLITSLKSIPEIYTFPPSFFMRAATLENYVLLFELRPIFRFLLNSSIVTGTTVLGSVLIALLAAYPFARIRFPIKSLLLLLVLLPRTIPGITRLIPIYLLIVRAGMMNTHVALILTYLSGSLPLSIWILIGAIHAIPRELEESAMIDGCSTILILKHIIVPLSIPGMIAAGVIAFSVYWNEFLLADSVLPDTILHTLPVALMRIRYLWDLEHPGLVNAMSTLVILPTLIAFLSLSRYFVRGLVTGSVKG